MCELSLLDDQERFARTAFAPKNYAVFGLAAVLAWIIVGVIGWVIWHVGALVLHAIQKAIGG